jgi:hypothetical protein
VLRTANHQRSADDIERALKVNVLRAEMFQGRRAASITTQDLKNYRTRAALFRISTSTMPV